MRVVKAPVRDPSPLETSLRPVTPLAIIAHNLARLRERAYALAFDDADFMLILRTTEQLASGLDEYLTRVSSPESTFRAELAADTVRRNWTQLFAEGRTALALESEMVSGHVEGELLKILVRATRARSILEVGLFTGYSALAMAEALPPEGRLVACEVDAYAAEVARHWFDRSPHAAKIHIELGPALATLERLREAGRRFDFVFIDADKARYADYFESIVGSPLLAENGLICVDNTLMQGEPYLPGPRTKNGQAIADFNRLVADDARVEQVLLPVRDGVTLIRRVSA